MTAAEHAELAALRKQVRVQRPLAGTALGLHPVAQGARMNPKIAGDHSDRLARLCHDPHRTSAELRIEPSSCLWHSSPSSKSMPPRNRGKPRRSTPWAGCWAPSRSPRRARATARPTGGSFRSGRSPRSVSSRPGPTVRLWPARWSSEGAAWSRSTSRTCTLTLAAARTTPSTPRPQRARCCRAKRLQPPRTPVAPGMRHPPHRGPARRRRREHRPAQLGGILRSPRRHSTRSCVIGTHQPPPAQLLRQPHSQPRTAHDRHRSGSATAYEPAPTSTAASQKAKPKKKPSAASNASSPESSTAPCEPTWPPSQPALDIYRNVPR